MTEVRVDFLLEFQDDVFDGKIKDPDINRDNDLSIIEGDKRLMLSFRGREIRRERVDR